MSEENKTITVPCLARSKRTGVIVLVSGIVAGEHGMELHGTVLTERTVPREIPGILRGNPSMQQRAEQMLAEVPDSEPVGQHSTEFCLNLFERYNEPLTLQF